MYNKKMSKNGLLRVYKGEYVLISDTDIYNELNNEISSLNAQIRDLTNELDKQHKTIQELKNKPTSSQFKAGDIKLTYTRLNGKVETITIDKNEKLAKNFKVSEFLMNESTCKKHKLSVDRCKTLVLSEKLIATAQMIREKYNKSVNITSGYRDKDYNKAIGGDTNSDHIKGRAMDFNVSGINKNEVLKYVKTLPFVSYAYTNDTNMALGIHISVKE
jgi:uncharacterized protein YcbK (DUF882 family)